MRGKSFFHPLSHRKELFIGGVKFTALVTFLLTLCMGHWAVVVATDETGDRPIYTIGPGDQLLVTVVGYEQELTARVEVRPDGMISYPVVGDVEAAGLTILQQL